MPLQAKSRRIADRTFRAGSLLAALFGAWLPSGGLRAQTSPGPERVRVERVTFVGVQSVDGKELARGLATKPTRCRSVLARPFCWISDANVFVERRYLDEDELVRDDLRIRVFYFRRGFRDAEVTTSVRETDDGVEVVFEMAEGPPTRIVERRIIQTDTVLDERALRRLRIPEPGAPLSLVALDTAMARLRTALWQRAYADAVVDDSALVSDGANAAWLEILVAPGKRATVEAVHVTGNQELSERTIRNSMAFRPGDLFRRGDVLVSQRNLYESNLFRQAVIEVPEPQDSSKVVNVAVIEAPLRSAHTAAGFNTVDFIQTEGGYTNLNWFGGARRLDVTVTLGNLLASSLNDAGIFRDVTPDGLTEVEADAFLDPTWQASVAVTQPWFRGFRNTLSVAAFTHRRSVPGVVIDRGWGARASFSRIIASRTTASLTYSFEETRVEAGDLYFCVDFGICDIGTIEALQSRRRLSPLGISILAERANDPTRPTSGYTWRLIAENASSATLSDFRYNRVWGEGTVYARLGGGVIAGRIRAGYVEALESTREAMNLQTFLIDPVLHPRKRFYAGGSRSVRGFGENQLGPRVLTIAPSVLIDPERGGTCSLVTIITGDCNPGTVPSDEFDPRPLGGDALVEGSIEFRFPLTRTLGGAVFVDAGSLSQRGPSPFEEAFWAITPGFGFRYYSPIGAVRADLGFRPRLRETLPVVTQFTDPNGIERLIQLDFPKEYDPLEGKGGLRRLLSRLALHLSIGQAF